MTAFIPNTRVTVGRPAATADAWGDEGSGGVTTVASGVPAAVTETFQRTYLGTEDRGGVVETITVRLRPGTDVREGDRLTTTQGLVLQVEAVSSPPAIAGLTDVRVSARRTSARS